MLFMYLLSIVSFVIQAIFITLAIAAGLYYLAELVEEYSMVAKNTISWLIIKYHTDLVSPKITCSIHIGLLIFEELPLHVNILGLVQQMFHFVLIKDFPVVRVTSVTFISSLLLLCVNHYLAFKAFSEVYYSFSEVLAYFSLCLWIVPFALFVSLSANDYVLPTTLAGERQPLISDNNVVTDYLSRQSKQYSLLSFFSFAKESILPQRSKKAF